MARDAIAFLAAMQFSHADLLGFNIGSFIAPADRADAASDRPPAGPGLLSAPGRGMHARLGAGGHRRDRNTEYPPEAYLEVFFASQRPVGERGWEALRRMYARTENRNQAMTWATREAH